jgi:hypothetical protein
MARDITEKDTFSSTCVVEGREAEGRFNIVRKGTKQTRVIGLGKLGAAELVDTAKIKDVQEVPKPEKEATPATPAAPATA